MYSHFKKRMLYGRRNTRGINFNACVTAKSCLADGASIWLSSTFNSSVEVICPKLLSMRLSGLGNNSANPCAGLLSIIPRINTSLNTRLATLANLIAVSLAPRSLMLSMIFNKSAVVYSSRFFLSRKGIKFLSMRCFRSFNVDSASTCLFSH